MRLLRIAATATGGTTVLHLPRAVLIAATAAVVMAIGCSSSDSKPAAASSAAHVPATTRTTATPIQPVPDTHKNKVGRLPFTIALLQEIAPEPRDVTGSQVLVENTSDDFTGIAQREVQYSVGSEVVGTNTGHTDVLNPGQQQTIWIDAFANRNVTGQYGTAQLISLWFSSDTSQPGTKLQLAF
ncbi:hypothetical protein [Nocardia sp. NPDC046763]|uniref:hypothetical protein n=1 Tax=Nocardia sp. NPDC046763 TaxID=3155256 RepID=UPI003409770F